jgi:predicted nucleic acid-binding protein
MRRLLDINTWIALTVETHPQHRAARTWYEQIALMPGDLVFCLASGEAFFRLSRAVEPPPFRIEVIKPPWPFHIKRKEAKDAKAAKHPRAIYSLCALCSLCYFASKRVKQ